MCIYIEFLAPVGIYGEMIVVALVENEADLYQLCYFLYQEDYPGYGSHPCFHRSDCSLRNHPSDVDERLCSTTE